MTPTPYERAREIVGDRRAAVNSIAGQYGSDAAKRSSDFLSHIEQQITAAITQAQDDKLEEAALVASNESIHPLADQIADAIRALKQQKD